MQYTAYGENVRNERDVKTFDLCSSMGPLIGIMGI